MQPELKTTAPGNYHSNSQDAPQGWLEVGNVFQVADSLNSCVFELFYGLPKKHRNITLKINQFYHWCPI